MILINRLRLVPSHIKLGFASKQKRSFVLNKNVMLQTARAQENMAINEQRKADLAVGVTSPSTNRIVGHIFPTARVVPMVISNKEPVILSFDDVPGPKSLKYLSSARGYLSAIGTQITAGILTVGLNIGK